MADQIQKIYDLRSLGYDKLIVELNNIHTAFEQIRAAKAGLNSQAQTSIEDPARLAAISQELKLLLEQEQALKVKAQELIVQAKEMDIIRKLEQEQARRTKADNSGLQGSYNALKKEIKELYDAVKAAPKGSAIAFKDGSVQSYDQAIEKLKQLTAAEQEFRRQFQADGTLVGEYTTGIVKAFERMGLGDLLKDQLNTARGAITNLDAEFEVLRAELEKIRATGQGSLGVVERQLIENRQAALTLEQQLESMRQSMAGVGTIGEQVTSSLKEGFKNVRTQLAQVILGYVGFQAILQGIRSTFQDTVRIDSMDTALRNVSGTERELAINNKFLQETTDRLGLTLLDTTVAFKGFYAAGTQAGLTAAQTRDIFFAAAAASANLKLSQEDTNGVLLAFGQIASKGKVQAEELRGQIGERIPGAFAIAARAIGVTQVELNKMLENGKVISAEFLPKFAAELQKTFGGNTTKNVEGLQAGINRLKNQFTELLINNKGLSGGIITGLVGALSTLIGLLPTIITLFTAWGTILAIANAAQIRLWITTQASTIAFKAQYAWLVISETFTKAYTAAINLLTASQQRAVAASTLLRVSLSLLGVGAVIAVIALLAGAFSSATAAITGNVAALRAQADVMSEALKRTAEARSNLDFYGNVVRSTTASEDARRKAMEALIKINPKFSEAIVGNTIDMQRFNDILKETNSNLLKQAKFEAARAKTVDTEKKIQELQDLRRKLEFGAAQPKGINIKDLTDEEAKLLSGGVRQNIRNTFNDAFDAEDLKVYNADINKQIGNLTQSLTAYSNLASQTFLQNNAPATAAAGTSIKRNIDLIQKDLEAATSAFHAAELKSDEYFKQQKLIKQYQAELDAADPKTKHTRASHASTLGAVTQDRFKDIEAVRDARIVSLEKAYQDEDAAKKGFEGKQIDNERIYLETLLKINEDAGNAKIAKLNGKNAEERRVREKIELDIIKLRKETNTKLFELDKQALDEKKAQDEREARETRDKVTNDPASSDVDKSAAEAALSVRMIEIHQKYNTDADDLEKKRNKVSLKNQQERADALLKDEEAASKSRLAVTKAENDAALTELRKGFDENTQAIRDRVIAAAAKIFDSNAKAREKRRQLDRLENEAAQDLLNNDIARIDAELDANLRLYNAKRISAEEFNKRDKELREQRYKDVQDKNAKEITNEEKKERIIHQLREAAYQITSTLASAYFDIQNQKIDKNADEAKSVRDTERQARLDHAQSQAEKDAINKQYDAKEKEAERQRNIDRQETAKKQLAIEFALASIKAISTSTNIYEGIIKEAVVLAEYLSKLAVLNSQKFEQGGVPTNGGSIIGPSHASGGVPFRYEAEGGELAIINKRSAASNAWLSVSGTPKMIASAINSFGGGVNFQPGAYLKQFASGGMIGGSVQPPVFQSYYNRGGSADLSEVKSLMIATQQMIAATQATILAESAKKVELNPNAVTRHQRAQDKAVSLATI